MTSFMAAVSHFNRRLFSSCQRPVNRHLDTIIPIASYQVLVSYSPLHALMLELLYYDLAGPSTWAGETECTTDLVQPRLCESTFGKSSVSFLLKFN